MAQLAVSDAGKWTEWTYDPNLDVSDVGAWTEWEWQDERRAHRHIGMSKGSISVT